MADARGRSRINFEVSQETFDRAERLIPWGMKNKIYTPIIEQLLDAIEEEGLVVVGLIMDGKLRLFGRD
jgi:hypothetical protein